MNILKSLTKVLVIIAVLSTLSCTKEEAMKAKIPAIVKETDPADSLQITHDSLVTIGLYADEGAAPACIIAAENMFQWMGHTTKRIFSDDINNYNIADIDIFYFPGGSTAPYMDSITENGKDYIRFMIKRGCAYIGTCAGAIFACEVQDWGCVSSSTKQLGIFPGIASGPNTEIFAYPEIGMCKINFSEPHQITQNLEDSIWIMYYNGPFFTINDGADAICIGNFDITNGPAIVACEYGEGRVFLTSPHPEWEEDDSRDGVSYFDMHDDKGSDWPLMKNATNWCIEKLEK